MSQQPQQQFVKVIYDCEEWERDYGWHLIKNQIKLFDSVDDYHKFIDSSFNTNKFNLISVVFGDIVNVKSSDVVDERIRSSKRIDDNEKVQEERERQEKIKKLQKELEELQNRNI